MTELSYDGYRLRVEGEFTRGELLTIADAHLGEMAGQLDRSKERWSE